ncbi:TrmO family methyltransferase [Agrobacterium sp. fls2-241-TYG-188a]
MPDAPNSLPCATVHRRKALPFSGMDCYDNTPVLDIKPYRGLRWPSR